MTLPGASELFRSTGAPPTTEPAPKPRRKPSTPAAPAAGPDAPGATGGTPGQAPGAATPAPSGRQRHDEKITVYVSAAELLALEQARLSIRAQYGMACDRGRIVREAVAVLLADFEENGDSSLLARRLGVGR